jgi:hypothetical protein
MPNTVTSVAMKGAFKGLKTPRELLNFNLMRGVTDFSNLEQWDLYEKGYPFLCVVSIPQFLRDLAAQDDNARVIIDNYVHILENDFRGIDNIDNITGETGEITNGIRSIQIINKVMKPTNSNFTLSYYERSGSILTKAHELYLTGIKDPDTQVKTYHGLIDAWTFNGVRTISGMDPGPHQECFSFMYFLTDNTMTKIERAFLIAASQPTSANYTDLYTGNKGEIQFAEVSLPFNGFFINNDYVYQKAQDMLLAMRNPNNLSGSRIIVDSNNFKYNAIAHAGIGSSDGKPTFDTPRWWAQEAGRAIESGYNGVKLGSDTANLINTENRKVSSDYARAVYTEGTTGDNADINVYKNVVASMSGSEHIITPSDGAIDNTNLSPSNTYNTTTNQSSGQNNGT